MNDPLTSCPNTPPSRSAIPLLAVDSPASISSSLDQSAHSSPASVRSFHLPRSSSLFGSPNFPQRQEAQAAGGAGGGWFSGSGPLPITSAMECSQFIFKLRQLTAQAPRPGPALTFVPAQRRVDDVLSQLERDLEASAGDVRHEVHYEVACSFPTFFSWSFSVPLL